MDDILAKGRAVQAALLNHIDAKRRQDGQSTWTLDLLDRLEPYAIAGKLLRGGLVCFSFEMFSRQTATAAVIKTAAALELTHSALLIHDDIMDNDDLRRGRPAMHRQYQLLAEKQQLATDTRLFGLNLGLGAGDAVLFWAFELLTQAKVSPQTLDLYFNQLIKTCDGQMQDIYLEARSKEASRAEIYQLMESKTAGYTMVLPLTMGAALADQPLNILKQLQTVGLAAGTIFQIRDDELGVMGSSAKTGKPVGADIKQGKKTLLRYYLLKNSSRAECIKLKAIFGNPTITPKDIKYVQQLVKQRGIDRLLNKELGQLSDKAFKSIIELPLNNNGREKLEQLVNFSARRQF